MNSTKITARIAGLLYLIIILAGFFSLRYVPSKIINWDNASSTFNNVKSSETLFRLGILSELIGYTAFLLLPLVLYKLLKPVDKTFALLMEVFAIACVPKDRIENLYKKFRLLAHLDCKTEHRKWCGKKADAHKCIRIRMAKGIEVFAKVP